MNRKTAQPSLTGRGRLIGGLAFVLAVASFGADPAASAPLAGAHAIVPAAHNASVIEPAVVARRRAVAVGPRGGVAVRRGAVAVGPRGAAAVRRTVVIRPVRPLARRAYYGTIVGGVALGTLIAATAVPVAPAAGLCWFWADPARTQGYWDYCKPR